MTKVFICSPYRGDIEKNIEEVKQYCKLAISKDCLPIAPHLYFPLFLNDEIESERMIGINAGLKLLETCDEVWVFKTPTEGMKKEIELAEKLNKKIIYMFKKDLNVHNEHNINMNYDKRLTKDKETVLSYGYCYDCHEEFLVNKEANNWVQTDNEITELCPKCNEAVICVQKYDFNDFDTFHIYPVKQLKCTKCDWNKLI